MPGFTLKNWIDEANHAGPPAAPPGTPLSAAGMEDAEDRLSTYTTMLAGTTAGIYNVVDYGATAGTADSATAFQSAIDAAEAANGVVYVPKGTFTIDSNLTLDVAHAGMVSHRAKLDFANMAAGTALSLTGSVNPPYTQSFTALEGLEMEGNSTSGSVVGLGLNNSSGGGEGPSHVSFQNLNIHDFGYGIKFDDRAYLTNVYSSDIAYCGVGIETVADSTDSGERLAFFGCAIYGCTTTAVRARNPNGDMYFHGCSFDYNYTGVNGQTFIVNNARVFCDGCHIEVPTTVTGRQVVVESSDQGLFVFRGGEILGGGASDFDYFFEVATTANSGGGVYLDGVFIHGIDTTTELLATGTGVFRSSNSQGHSTTLSSQLASTQMNLLQDGSFEAASIVDDVFIDADTAAITDRFNGTNIDLAMSATYARTGTKSLKATNAAAALSVFSVAAPVSRNSRPAGRLYYKKAGAQTGTMYITTEFAILRVNGDGVPTIAYSTATGSTQVDFTAATVDWTKVESGQALARTPPWATHFLLRINTAGVGAGDLYFDDFLITEI